MGDARFAAWGWPAFWRMRLPGGLPHAYETARCLRLFSCRRLRIAGASAYVLALGKRAFYAQDQLPEDGAYDIACEVMVNNAQADDAHEGMRAFLEKRAPQWRNR